MFNKDEEVYVVGPMLYKGYVLFISSPAIVIEPETPHKRTILAIVENFDGEKNKKVKVPIRIIKKL